MTTDQTARLMTGTDIAAQIVEKAAARGKALQGATGVQPCLATVLVGENFGRLFKYASNTLCPERIRRGANEHVNASAFVFERAPGPKIFEIVFFVELSLHSLLFLGPKVFTVLSTEASHGFRASLGKNNPQAVFAQ